MLVTSISGTAFAQENHPTNSEKLFDINADYFRIRYQFDLGKGNKLQIELRDITDLSNLPDIDSLLRIVITGIAPLKDTLSNEITAKRLDYRIDPGQVNKVRIQEFKPKGSSFLVGKAEVAGLKLEQDTVNIITVIANHYLQQTNKGYKYKGYNYARISFFINHLDELNSYVDGTIDKKIELLKKNLNEKWVDEKGMNGSVFKVHLKDNPTITATHPRGYLAKPGVLSMLNVSINLQNYKNIFVPSASTGAIFNISNSFFKHEVGIFWEPNFFFASNAQGKLQTFRNDFLTVSWGHGFIRDHDARKESNLLAIFSYSYLIHRSGEFIDKHTSHIGAGRLSLFDGKTKIEPGIYFNDFFKGVTPGLKLIQRF